MYSGGGHVTMDVHLIGGHMMSGSWQEMAGPSQTKADFLITT